ncbi:TIGR03915 family putative DNA repair protein [Aquipseudomonas campi]|uniref:TIGR03915 family putative DNA repair protein n=1 Tax=Aquipseudomonas campi TaxID=2731681 RepID=A0A6M8FM67_9GAMM|nr:TIGR03915 family putative DNA repair protein [Pseudomonas campi]QKE65777.1 TIGR03915 family putative DNA repair protein [Pseudomonas campi]
MVSARFDGSFAGWRQAARELLQQGVTADQVTWYSHDGDTDLFAAGTPCATPHLATTAIRVPRQLLNLLESAARYRCADRWSLLYRVLWRVSHGDRSAMLAGDADGSELHKRLKAVRREAHHLHAFLRFQPCHVENGPDFVAWHEPAHDILHSASGHFAERMGQHSWLIATPQDGVYWDGQRLQHQQHCPQEWQQLAQAPGDEGQQLWLAYYGSTFNPARLNRSVLENNMPVRFWKNLPEGPLIPQLMSQARAGAQRDGQAQAVAQRSGKIIRYRNDSEQTPSGSVGPGLPR